ncbi:undecaprenyl-diphosphatase [Blattabacterium sp. (Blattella germanica) str. Bge]|uniref:undecaprenyl-diphosphate phosphatase n=1 Tax=Blattabacterium sp. (Blattella germanica) TaxID=624186 RepID=UPI0001BB61A9|nr:undecaprenyl-diphosphate phosphatase [Blattabacterium sp. (Blattella germanica)]ACY40371.1 undecaprenyl-diphosphatase [Blattabacterium sp. (Blattella germanica) str. Bge]
MNYIQSILLGIIEGITEFFPISSTGHMILAASIMGILEKKITNLFLVSVQLGAVLSVVFLYRNKFFFQKWDFYLKIFVSSFPVGILGFFFQKTNFLLGNPLTVALSLFIGGLVILKTENFYEKNSSNKKNSITYLKAFIIGLFQCMALIPGVSRSASTIVACLLQNISRRKSIEFSFFLSVPVIGIATCKKLFDYYFQLNSFTFQEIELLFLGNLAAFITGIIAVKFFMKYLKKNNFKFFGYYRIILGIFFLVIHYLMKPLGKF